MKVAVVAPFEAGSAFAHAINSVKMAEGFAANGHEVTIICRKSPAGSLSAGRLAELYGLSARLNWIQLSRKWKEQRGFTWAALRKVVRSRADFLYARHYGVPAWVARLGIPTAAETHAHPDNASRHFRRMVAATRRRQFRLLVTISHYLADHYRTLGVPGDKLIVLPDAVDLSLFRRPSQLRKSPYRFPGPHVTYAGHLYDYKGIPTVLETARRLPDVRFHFVGGWPDDVARQQQRALSMRLGNVHFHGLVPHSAVAPFLWHADALVLPPSGDHPSARWTSPVKLGEYLAAGTPVIATDIPALRDWLDDDIVRFVPPDDAELMAGAIQEVLESPAEAGSRVAAGQQLAEQLTYIHRTARILEAAGAVETGSLNRNAA